MKKISFLLVLFLLFPLMVFADDYKVTSHMVDAEIEIAGGLHVKELIVVEGTTDHITRTLNYYSFGKSEWDSKTVNFNNGTIYNGHSIENLTVGVYEVTGEIGINDISTGVKKYLSELTPKTKDENVFSKKDSEDGTVTVNVFYPVKNKKTAFYLEYTISNVVVEHEDVQELNYTFKNMNMGSSENVIRLLIPYATKDELYHIWVHGNQSGKVQELINKNKEKMGIYGTFTEINDAVNIRTLIPKDQVSINITINKSNKEALDEVVKLENDRAKDTKISNKIIGFMKYVLWAIGALYAISSIILLKYKYNVLFYIYMGFGLFIMVFNYLFGYNYWYLYAVIIVPLLIKLYTLLKNKTVKKKR